MEPDPRAPPPFIVLNERQTLGRLHRSHKDAVGHVRLAGAQCPWWRDGWIQWSDYRHCRQRPLLRTLTPGQPGHPSVYSNQWPDYDH